MKCLTYNFRYQRTLIDLYRDPYSGQPVVQTVSCMKMQKRPAQKDTSNVKSKKPTTTDDPNKMVDVNLNEHAFDNDKSFNDTTSCTVTITSSKEQSKQNEKHKTVLLEKRSEEVEQDRTKISCVKQDNAIVNNIGDRTNIGERTSVSNDRTYINSESKACVNNGNRSLMNSEEKTGVSTIGKTDNESCTTVEREQVSLNRRLLCMRYPVSTSSSSSPHSDDDGENNAGTSHREDLGDSEQSEVVENVLSTYGQGVRATRQVRSEIWNFTLGGAAVSPNQVHLLLL